MILYLIGINYRTTPRKVREEAYRLRDEIAEYWEKLNPGKVAMLSTCNRIEIYSSAGTYRDAAFQVGAFKKFFERQFANAYVIYGEREVFKHGLRLACGLESQFKGEYQILQQVKMWHGSGKLPTFLADVWQRIISDAAEIRNIAGLDEDTVDIAKILFAEIKKHFFSCRRLEILVIGTGKIAELLARQKPWWLRLSFVARKKQKRARKLADLTRGQLLLLDDIAEYLVSSDAVISATSSPHYVLTTRHFKKALDVRKRPLYIYDMAMPSDVAPEIGTISFVKLRNLDDLALSFFRSGNYIASRISLAEELIEKKVSAYKEFVYETKDTSWHAPQRACAQAGLRNNKTASVF